MVLPLDGVQAVDIGQAQQLGRPVEALLGERRGLVLFVDGVIAGGVLFARLLAFDHFAAHQLGDDAVGLVILVGGFFAGAGNDQRGAGFVDQDGIDFVDDGVVVRALHAVLDAELHVVAQVIEAEFVVGAVGDIGGVGFLALLVVQVVHDHAHAQAQELVEPAHPFGVALGQVIVDRDHVHALAFERVEVARQGGDQRLTFAGLHFGDSAVVQHHAADQLDVEMAHVEHAAAGFADHGEGLDQQVVERGALGDPFFEFDGLGGEVDIGQLAHLRLEIVDGGHRGPHLFDLALSFGAEDFCQNGVNNHE